MIAPIESNQLFAYKQASLAFKRFNTDRKTQPVTGEDSYEPSHLAKRWMRSGLNPSSSLKSAENDRLEFNLNYTSSVDEALSASGYYYKEQQTLDVTFNYQFRRLVEADGQHYLKTFEMNFSLHADQVEEKAAVPFLDQQDILEFIRDLANDVIDKAADEKEKLVGVILDKKDVAEILGLEKGKIAKLIFTLIASVLMLEQIRHAGDEEDEVENVMLKAVREQREGLKLEHHSKRNLSMDLSIAELRSEPIDRASVAEEKPQTNTVDPSSENSTDPEVNQ